jgi:hypothetical protein
MSYHMIYDMVDRCQPCLRVYLVPVPTWECEKTVLAGGAI